MHYIFLIRNEHTEWLRHERSALDEEHSVKNVEAVSIKIEEKVHIPYKHYVDLTLYKYLEELLRDWPERHLFMEESKEEARDIDSKSELNFEECKIAREELIDK